MANQGIYIPKLDDLVLIPAHQDSFTVVAIDTEAKTVDVEALTGNVLVVRDVPWSLLSPIDANEQEARMQRMGQKRNRLYLSPREKL